MSAPPFMQMYWADYFGDTRHLSCEQHGAYLQLLGSMWLAGGVLPNDPRKLAKMTGCTASRWARIQADVLALFEVEGDCIQHKRLKLELKKAREKSIKLAEVGSLGGKAKALKTLEPPLANATETPAYARASSDIRDQIPEKTTDDDSARARFSDIDRATITDLEKRLREAGGIGINTASPMLQVVAPILGLLRPGEGPACDLELDVIPAIMAASTKVRRPVDRWDYFVPMIREARDRRLQGAPAVGEVTQIRSTGPPNSFMDRLEADRAEARRRAING